MFYFNGNKYCLLNLVAY
uniref:Uncharacterized protein n=1 Tax=Anguilla anguilla TaxID=7936 RepID=A0A0E9PLB2_ANGAN